MTYEELHTCFQPEIRELAVEQELTEADCLTALKQTYYGYHFHPFGPGVYYPYSLLNAFSDGEFGSCWFETGTPTFLVKKLREIEFDVRKFTNRTLYASEGMLKDYSGDSQDPVPLLYQTGYLTIAGFDRIGRVYTLAFPNEEVKYGFVECLMPEYIADSGAGSGIDIFTLRQNVDQGETEKIREVLTALFANITCTGRIDCKVETKDYIYLFEFKRDDTAQAALVQIDSKDYALPFVADSRKLYKIGVSFDSATRRLVGWEVKE